MGLSLSQKIIKNHLVKGELIVGEEVAVHIDQTLTQDATGTMTYLQFESIGVSKVKTELSVSYVDHNTLQNDFKNADDHLFLSSFAKKYGLVYSPAGNGICHQLHLERFALPQKTLIGSDSHTPTAGAVGSLAIGSGGLDVALAMAGEPFRIKYPKILGIELVGRLNPWVSAKDVILTVLSKVGVKGGVGYIIEYFGKGVKTLSIEQRATITNMGAETGATSSIFPVDGVTLSYLKQQKRLKNISEFFPDIDVKYDKTLKLNLGQIEPMVAKPHSPGNVKKVSETKGIKLDQVCIGSCTNSSFEDLSNVATILFGKRISENIHLIINPGSRQVVSRLIKSGAFQVFVDCGARIAENACGACIGMGAAPPSGGVSVRTYNRNFLGRSGTADAKVYLTSPEVAAASALKGYLTTPKELGIPFKKIKKVPISTKSDNMFILPNKNICDIIRGPNIKKLPQFLPLKSLLKGKILLTLQDDITTDDIMPAGSKILPFRSNIPKISEFVFEAIDSNFYKRAKSFNGGFIVAGKNYGQGSSREHAALAPKYLGVKAIIAKSYARIHVANLINFGIAPLIFFNSSDYKHFKKGDDIELSLNNFKNIVLKNITKNKTILLTHSLSKNDIKILLAGGKLAWVKGRG